MGYHPALMGVSLPPNTIFARDYRILRPLNEGGMGAVYVVEQLSTGSQRALKLMHPEFVSDARSRQRFEQEARVGARIESEHVVQVLAAGVDDATGYPYIVMELLKGEDLAAALHRRGALTPAEVGHIYAQLCHALAAAHASGVVHRDLKPENIFLAASHREGAAFIVKVLDFGIAKVFADVKSSSTAAIGTPLWMAPEQTTPNAHIGPQTDVWALGLIAFRMLTGRLYWVSGNTEDANTASLMREILFEPVIPASQRAAQIGVAHLLPPGFDAWFHRCVNRDVPPRFAHAGEVRAALAQILSGHVTASAQGTQMMPGVATTPAPLGTPQHTPAQPPLPPPPVHTMPQPPLTQQATTAAVSSFAAAPERPSGVPPRPGLVPLGSAVTPPGVQQQSQPKKKGAPVALLAVAGGGLVVVALATFGLSKMKSARDRSACEKNTPTASESDAKDTAAACERACSNKGGEACVNHGELVDRFKIGEGHAEVARLAFEKACDGGEMRGCRRAAARAERTDVRKAAKLYANACDKGDMPSCTGLGALHELGVGVSRDRARAVTLYDKACQEGDALGCAYHAFMLGAGRGVKQDEAKAGELVKSAVIGLGTACDRGEAKECVALAALLDKKEEARAVKLEQQACDQGEPVGCTNLGVRTLLGLGVTADAKKAAALFKQGCDGGDPSACTDLGLLDAKVYFGVRRGVRGASTFKLGCEGIYGVGCAGWGMLIPTPADHPADLPAAVSLSTKACDGGELVACVNLGAFHQYGVGTPKNREKASELFKKACDAGDAGGCGELGSMYSTGRGVPLDGKRAMDLFQQACDWGERDACTVIGDLKIAGLGVPKAPEEGVGIYKTYCDKYNLAMACNAFAVAQVQGKGVKRDPAAAVAMLREVCDGKKDRPYPTACVTLGSVLESGLIGQKDYAGAAKLYQGVCDAGSITGCTALAKLLAKGLGVPKDQPKARSLVESGCKAGDAGACDALGLFHAMGEAGLPANGAEAIKYLQLACDDASWGSCTNIGLLYLLGIAGTPRDPAKAAEYLKLACSRGDEGACQKVKENRM